MKQNNRSHHTVKIFVTGLLLLFYINSFSQYYEDKQDLRFGFVMAMKFYGFPKDYTEFEPLLGKDNIELMNYSDANICFEMAGTYDNFYAGLNYGYLSANKNTDSLNIEFNSSQYGITFGYNRINTERVIIRPELAITWYRSRLINSNKERKVPIEQYILNLQKYHSQDISVLTAPHISV
jgi:hypothetical protein